MNVKTNRLLVKGSHYYEAAKLLRNERLHIGTELRFEPDLTNQFDCNAVKILHADSGALIGHVSSAVAMKYKQLCQDEKIISVKVCELTEGERLKIYISVVHNSSEQKVKTSNVSFDLTSIPPTCGVYSIKNSLYKRQYIGSTENLKQRARQHFSALENDTHHNRSLQNDFNQLGGTSFSFSVVEFYYDKASVILAESCVIETMKLKGCEIYNNTDDGQGRIPVANSKASRNATFMSDEVLMPVSMQPFNHLSTRNHRLISNDNINIEVSSSVQSHSIQPSQVKRRKRIGLKLCIVIVALFYAFMAYILFK